MHMFDIPRARPRPTLVTRPLPSTRRQRPLKKCASCWPSTPKRSKAAPMQFEGDDSMRFLIKVAGTQYHGIFPSNDAAHADALERFPAAMAVVVLRKEHA